MVHLAYVSGHSWALREVKAGAEPEAMEELYSLAGFLAHAQLAFLYNPGPPV